MQLIKAMLTPNTNLKQFSLLEPAKHPYKGRYDSSDHKYCLSRRFLLQFSSLGTNKDYFQHP